MRIFLAVVVARIGLISHRLSKRPEATFCAGGKCGATAFGIPFFQMTSRGGHLLPLVNDPMSSMDDHSSAGKR